MESGVARRRCGSSAFRFWSGNETVPLFTSSIGLLIILLYIPGGFTQIAYWARGRSCAGSRSHAAAPVKTVTVRPPSLSKMAPASTLRQ